MPMMSTYAHDQSLYTLESGCRLTPALAAVGEEEEPQRPLAAAEEEPQRPAVAALVRPQWPEGGR